MKFGDVLSQPTNCRIGVPLRSVLFSLCIHSGRCHLLSSICGRHTTLYRLRPKIHYCVITNTSKYQHITPTLKKLHWLPIKQRIDYKLCLLTYKTLTNQQPTYLYNTIIFHFRHTLFLHDLLIHSFYPFHMSDHHLAKGLSLSSVHDFGIHYLPIPEIRILYQLPVPSSKHTSSKSYIPSLGSFPFPWTVYPDFDSCYYHFMPYRITPSVRHRAIEAHYYYFYYYYYLSGLLYVPNCPLLSWNCVFISALQFRLHEPVLMIWWAELHYTSELDLFRFDHPKIFPLL